MSAPSRNMIISLYGDLLRTSRSFASYNFRNYFIRNTRLRFRENLNEKDPVKIQQLYDEGRKELEVLTRAAVVNRLYEGPRLVVEKSKLRVGGGGAGMEASA
ncbi:hypothetical protein FRC03_009520 [Tulasnella sp. 419]|nr:hypothetical protein FRC02_009144 [Tulasnella sp. 418]KAG8967683.1 hypothetical protein FRC03_009520 [Tulasnella sp. 419]